MTSSASDEELIPPGTLFDRRFLVLAPVARGSMGELYRVRDTTLGREVALKVVRAEHADDPL